MKSPFQQIHDILWDEDKEEIRRKLVAELLESKRLRDIPEAIDEFVELIKDVIGEPQTDSLYDDIIHEVLDIRREQADNLAIWQNVSDAIIQLLHNKHTYADGLNLEDRKLLYNMYQSIAETYPDNYDDYSWIRFFIGHANTCFCYAKMIDDVTLIKQSIDLHEHALAFFDKGSFPEYWASHNSKCSEQTHLANVIFDAYELHPESFNIEFSRTPELIEQATENYLNEKNNKIYSSGICSLVERIDKAQHRYKKLKNG